MVLRPTRHKIGHFGDRFHKPISIKTTPNTTKAWFYQPKEMYCNANTHTHTHPFNGPLSRTTWVIRYQKGKTNLDFTEARDSEWQWNPLGHMQVCTSLQTDNHASTPPLSFLQAGCPSCCPTNSVKALKAIKALQRKINTKKTKARFS